MVVEILTVISQSELTLVARVLGPESKLGITERRELAAGLSGNQTTVCGESENALEAWWSVGWWRSLGQPRTRQVISPAWRLLAKTAFIINVATH